MSRNKSRDLDRLRFDGIYFRQHKSGYDFVLRFYQNGYVCGGYITTDPAESEEIFSNKTANHGCGTYLTHDNHITFSFVDEEGTIDYECELSKLNLNCNILSTHTHKKKKWVYYFTEFSK